MFTPFPFYRRTLVLHRYETMFNVIVRSQLRNLIVRPQRYLSDSSVTVDKSVLSKLRKKTGFPLLNCRKALEQFNNDIKQAEAWMREQAQKEGWSKASKLQGRPMSQGLVGLIEGQQSATILEINCETDFVARNEQFQGMVSQLTHICHENFSQRNQSKIEINEDELGLLSGDGKTLADHVALLVGNLGENIAVRRAAYLHQDRDTVLRSYIHAAGPQVVVNNCKLGKFAAMVKVEVPEIDLVAEQLCQHIVGMNPKEIGQWKAPKPEKVDKKKKKKGPDVEEVVEKGEETRLYDQEFLLEPSLTVRGFLQDNGPKVVDCVRIECGEDLGEED